MEMIVGSRLRIALRLKAYLAADDIVGLDEDEGCVCGGGGGWELLFIDGIDDDDEGRGVEGVVVVVVVVGPGPI